MAEQQSPTPMTTKIKEGIAALREGVIVIAIILLLVEPAFIGRIAEQAGLKSVFGMEFYEQLEQSGLETAKAEAALEAVTKEVTQLRAEIESLTQTANSTATPSKLKEEINDLAKNAGRLEKNSVGIKPYLQNSRRLQKDLLGRMPGKK